MGQCAAKSRLKVPSGKLPRSRSFNDVMERRDGSADGDLARSRLPKVMRSRTVSFLQALSLPPELLILYFVTLWDQGLFRYCKLCLLRKNPFILMCQGEIPRESWNFILEGNIKEKCKMQLESSY
jgi:hypothetical protein